VGMSLAKTLKRLQDLFGVSWRFCKLFSRPCFRLRCGFLTEFWLKRLSAPVNDDMFVPMKVLGIHHAFFRCLVTVFLELWHADAADDVRCGALTIEGEHPECVLKRAYAVTAPGDSVNLYQQWATTYDSSMVTARGYVMPQRVAQLFNTLVAAGRSPAGFGVTLDIGAGTGLVGEHLDGKADAIDISADMPGQAEAKGLYRKRIVADLTKPLNMIPTATYSGFVSSGTFSTGHVDSGCLPELLRIAKPGTLFFL